MVNIPNVVVLAARVNKRGGVTEPEEQPLRSFRAARLVDDSKRSLFLSTSREGNGTGTPRKTDLEDWIANGLQLQGARYTWLGYSDGHLKAGKVVFFREDTEWTVARLLHKIGDVHEVYRNHSYGKYAARLALSFSSTVDAQDVSSERAVLLEDLRAPDGSLHTDGCGMIRDSFARELCNSLHIPEDTSVFQIRRGGTKGVLGRYPDEDFERLCNTENILVDKSSVGPEIVIAFRHSMLKYRGGPTTLEINDHCSRPSSARLNEYIILLLITLDVPLDVFRKLLLNQLDLIGAIANDRDKALKAVRGELDASSTAFSQDLYSLLLAYHDLSEPYVQHKIKAFQQHQYSVLRDKLHIAVEDSAYLFGIVDEYGLLEADEVFVNIPGRTGVLAKPRVMAYRNPSYSPADIRVFRAVYREELKHLTNCIVFSRKSQHSVPDTMASGDLDGDQYLVVWDSDLIPKAPPPPQHRPLSASATSSNNQRRNADAAFKQAALQTFIDHRFNGFFGQMANQWKQLAVSTPQLANEHHTRELGILTESALDALKSGADMQKLRRRFNDIIKEARSVANRDPGFKNPLDLLRELVPRKDGAKMSLFTCDSALVIRDQDPTVWDDALQNAPPAMEAFNRELQQAIAKDSESKDGETEKRSFKNNQPKYAEIVTARYRERYFGGGTFAEMYVERMRASAWYVYGYRQGKQAFAWLGMRYLNEIRAGRPLSSPHYATC
ncbi:RdRP-domain-containing protein [Fomitopsis serialis]|uniref:RdRP-domain-containing protein n=1 Tax=Fomitopsis serialis TaxID=139415 RepID=UPI002007B9CE|nr:RdRP-domain-containing protein [Neoantrodia serialis]KAH9928858.1 RdRP-domain-containing protein [Neoantrodia serialis]